MTNFFFYNNLKNKQLIESIDSIFIIKDSYIYMDGLNMDLRKLNIYDTDILNGKFVSFPLLLLGDILDKLVDIQEIKYENRNVYKLDKIQVYIYNDECYKDAYIIY
jgi:hypothetical protein